AVTGVIGQLAVRSRSSYGNEGAGDEYETPSEGTTSGGNAAPGIARRRHLGRAAVTTGYRAQPPASQVPSARRAVRTRRQEPYGSGAAPRFAGGDALLAAGSRQEAAGQKAIAV